MDRFWIEVFAEMAKDACCDMVLYIAAGQPPHVALRRALNDIDMTRVALQELGAQLTLEDADVALVVDGKAVPPCP